MYISDSEQYTYSRKDDHSSLTREKLLKLDFESNDNFPVVSGSTNTSTTGSIVTGTSTPDIFSSSASSIASFDEQSDDYRHATSVYGDMNQNASNSSIATLVQKLTSSTSTLNLEPKALQSPNLITSISSAPQTPPNERVKIPRKIKSSLKLPGLTRSKSMPSTVSKTVRFSNTLTNVKTFCEYAEPSSISYDNSPEYSPSKENSPKAFFDLKSVLGNSDDSEDSDEDYFTTRAKYKRKLKWSLKCLNFDLLSFNSPITNNPVKLVCLSIPNDTSLIGAIEVSNLAFEKYVEVKFTTNDWKSVYIVTAKYERSINASKDRFSFEIDLKNSILFGNEKVLNSQNQNVFNVGLCVRYVIAGSQTYYDNNNSQNFKLQLISEKQPVRQRKTRKVSSPQTNFLTPPKAKSKFGSDNFINNDLNYSPSKPDNLTTSTTTRYFTDDTDYFIKPSIYNNQYFNTNDVEVPKKNSRDSSFSENLSTGNTFSSSSYSSLSTPSVSSFNSIDNIRLATRPEFKNNHPSYDEFLNKYCFFKSEDPNDIKYGSITI